MGIYKKRCGSKKGYFFILDSILALGVLVVGAVFIFTSYAETPEKDRAAILSEDIMDFFANNKIKDVDNDYAGIGGELWQERLIKNGDNTLLQQTAIFYHKGNFTIAEKFVENLTINRVPQQFFFEFWINETLIFPRGPSPAHNQSKNNTELLIPSRKIVHGILKPEEGEMFGPYEAEVHVWQR